MVAAVVAAAAVDVAAVAAVDVAAAAAVAAAVDVAVVTVDAVAGTVGRRCCELYLKQEVRIYRLTQAVGSYHPLYMMGVITPS